MKIKHEQPFILFSSDVSGHNTLADIINVSSIVSDLQRKEILFKQLLGKWRGNLEGAFLVNASHRDEVLELADKYNQTHVLYVDDRRSAYLITVADGRQEFIGTFTRVDKDFALCQDTYTYDPQHDQYWCVK